MTSAHRRQTVAKNLFGAGELGIIRVLHLQTTDQPAQQLSLLTEDNRAGFPLPPCHPFHCPCHLSCKFSGVWDLKSREEAKVAQGHSRS